MFYRVFYDGYALHDHCVINRVVKSTAPRSNTFLGGRYSSGARFKSTRTEPITIDLIVTIKEDVQFHLDEINRILSVREPRPLIVAQTPERMLMCMPTGNIEPSSFLRNSEFKISFESENSYWQSIEGMKEFTFNKDHVTADNKGNYPTHPRFRFEFSSDCGFIGLVAPNGYIYIGDPEEVDIVKAPANEYAIDGNIANLQGWTGVDISRKMERIADFDPTSYAPKPTANGWALNPKNDWSSKALWVGHALEKEFSPGKLESKGAENFEFNMKGIMTNNSPDNSALGMILAAILDEEGRPMMSTCLFDSKQSNNEVDIVFHLYDEEGSVVSRGTDHFKTFDGELSMTKMGSRFNWSVSSSGGYIYTQKNLGVSEPKIGDTVYIKSTARYGYDHVGNRFTIKDFTRGRAYKVTNSKYQNGIKRYLIEYNRVGVYWMNIEDLTGGKVEYGVQREWAGYDSAYHTAYNSLTAQRTASKLLLFIGRWGKSKSYSDLAISNPKVRRIYSSTYQDVPNSFKSGDVLTIDNAKGQILHNFKPIKAKVDVDSRFFEIDGGKTDIKLLKSSWADYPVGKISFEDRWY